jgi:hypothetical protein
MAYTIWGGHSCDAAAVRAGYCPDCKTPWTKNYSEWDLTKKALTGIEIRDENGEKLPLI